VKQKLPITPTCNKCKKELNEFGAILLSPPDKKNKTEKKHLCKKCYNQINENL
jgi:hypothetical protein